jgi:outer membrane lipoprotein-sorting protein
MFELLCGLLLAAAAPPDATEILRRADKAVLGDQAIYTLRMTVVRPGKTDREVEMKAWKKGDALGRVRYTAPAKERGTAYLRNGENTWMYLPNAEKVVRVGEKQSFGGSDFQNSDVFRLSLVDDYEATLAGDETLDGQACYLLELKAKSRSVAYDRVRYWVRRDGTFFPVRSEYYTISGKKLKWLMASDVATLGRRARPTVLTMESALDPGSRTTLRFLSIDDDVRLDDRLFTTSALERE